jgi:hypothetical protein
MGSDEIDDKASIAVEVLQGDSIMFMTSVPRRPSSTVWVLASFVSLGLAGCAAQYDNKAGITPQPVPDSVEYQRARAGTLSPRRG